LLFAGFVAGQDAYPSKPITMVVPFPPGGVADIVARPVAEAMSRVLKVPVVIENRAGAGGGIGMGHVAKAKPDGYTVLLALSSISIIPEADKVTERTPMYQLNSSFRSHALPPTQPCWPYARTARGTTCRSLLPMRKNGRAQSRSGHPSRRRRNSLRAPPGSKLPASRIGRRRMSQRFWVMPTSYSRNSTPPAPPAQRTSRPLP